MYKRQDETSRLADYLMLIENGKIIGNGPVNEMLTRFDLPMARSNEAISIFDAKVINRDPEFSLMYLEFSGGQFVVPDNGMSIESLVRIRVAARDVSLTKKKQTDTSILNIFPAVVEEIAPEGKAQIIVRLTMGGVVLLSCLTRKSASPLGLEIGLSIFVQVKSVAILS